MIKIRHIAQLLFCLLISTHAFSAEWNETEMRECKNFNANWRFILGDNPEFRETSFDDSEWRELTLPHWAQN